MIRLTTLSTVMGLTGMVLAMMTALGGGASEIVALGFGMMLLGLMGAVIGGFAALGRIWETTR